MKIFLSFIILLSVCFENSSNAQDRTNELKFSILNYEDYNQVRKLKKLEIGVALPPTIQVSVDRFIEKQRGDKINPFLEWELKLIIEFKHKSLESSIFIDGFYTQDFDSYMVDPLPEPRNKLSYTTEEYVNLGGYNSKKTAFNFHVRFSPPEIGEWEFLIHLNTQGKVWTSNSAVFNVIESNSAGYITVGENGRFLEQNNSMFYPIGGNAPWPRTIAKYDSVLAYKSIYNGIPFDEDYRTVTCVPRVYDVYRKQLNRFSDNGVNLIRTIMYPASSDIEWEVLGDYTERLPIAYELDQILELAEEKGFYYLWDLQIHYSFQESKAAYNHQWTWDSKIKGQRFCYQQLVDSEDPMDFFTNIEAKKYYKQKLRYIISRWGYSTHIAIFELFSEINNVVPLGVSDSIIELKKKDWTIFTHWQKEMGTHIKSYYNGKTHLLTSSFAGLKNKKDTVFVGEPFDIMSSNMYDFGVPSNSLFWSSEIGKYILNEDNSGSYIPKNIDGMERKAKPMIFSETGTLDFSAPSNYNSIELNRNLWNSIFSGLTGAFDWDFWFFDSISSFKQVAPFLSGYNFDKDQWHPGFMKQVDKELRWVYKKPFAKWMTSKNKKIDCSYLRSGDRNAAIGVISNNTYNIYSVENTIDELWDKQKEVGQWVSPIEITEKLKTFGRKNQKLKVKNLQRRFYVIEYYNYSNSSRPIATSLNMGPNIKLKTTLGDQHGDYLVLFKIRPK